MQGRHLRAGSLRLRLRQQPGGGVSRQVRQRERDGNEKGMEWMGWDETGRDGTGRYGTGWNGVRRKGIG